MNTSPSASDLESPNANAGSSQMWSFYAKYPERFGDSIVKLAYAFRVAEHYLMKRGVAKATAGGNRNRRKSVAQILRASYERFANDKETLTALKAVLGQGVKIRS